MKILNSGGRSQVIFAFSLLLVLAAILRFSNLGDNPLWQDEAYSLWFSRLSWHELWFDVPTYENHPPLYYMVLKAWRALAGESEFALRVPSALASLGVVVALFQSGRIIGGARAGFALAVMAGAVTALWDFQITYAAEARAYAFAALGVSMIMIGALFFLTHPEEMCAPLSATRRDPAMLGAIFTLACGMAIGLWANVLGVVSAVLAGLYLGLWWAFVYRFDVAVFWKLFISAILALALYFPNTLFLINLSSRDVSGFWLAPPAPWEALQMTLSVFSQPVFELGLKAELVVTSILIIAGGIGLIHAQKDRGAQRLIVLGFLVTLSFGYWLGLLLITYGYQPLLLPRTLIYAQPPILLILAGLPWALGRFNRGLALGFIVYLTLGALNPPAPEHPRVAYDEMVRHIAESEAPAAPVVVVPANLKLVLEYYEDRQGVDLNLFPLPTPHERQGDEWFANTEPVTVAMTEKALVSIEHEPLIWYVIRAPSVWSPDRAIQTTLEAAGRRSEVRVGQVNLLPNLRAFILDHPPD